MQRFSLRYGRLSGPLLGVLGAGRRVSGLDVGDGLVALHMGWWFRGEAELSAVRGASEVKRTVASRGVHGWRGSWLVNGAGDGLVEVQLEPPMRARTLGIPLAVRRLCVSVEEPAQLVEALRVGSGA